MTGQAFTREEFIQEVELYCIKFHSPIVRSNLATLNLEKKYLIYQGIPIVAFVANRDIEAGEQLGIKYGFRYWLGMKMQPELFEKSGRVMSKRDYERTDDFIIDNRKKPFLFLSRL
jgi:SET domain-containing protein